MVNHSKPPSDRNLTEAQTHYKAMQREIESLVLGRSPMMTNIRDSAVPHSLPVPDQLRKYVQPTPEQAFSDIIGHDEQLRQLTEAISGAKTNKTLFAQYDLTLPKGAILSGPPGCGKTMFARAAAAAIGKGPDAKFLALAGPSLQSKYVGETEALIRQIFSFAKSYHEHTGQQLLVFIDEAETILPDRNGKIYRWEESQVATFLSEMDGFTASHAFVLLATNRPEAIDPAILRDGRCDFKLELSAPRKKDVFRILEKAFTFVPLESGMPVHEAAQIATESFYDPYKVIEKAGARSYNAEGEVVKTIGKDFTFSYVVSGAMAANLPTRAKRFAFSRDRANNTFTGVNQADIINAVSALFEENKNLSHSYAMNKFFAEFSEELQRPKGMN